ncbi:RcnB family protein [Sphingomonas sp.]|uniref:RcnB family protein n=1 Tax=Sphingomonas sp. TaxID=28214 RepID=UPI002CDF61A9|nr:RcnB family protein [Sphingomonas sp.]HTG38346.1 RcnB family protein [Sphingomonas sp.]
MKKLMLAAVAASMVAAPTIASAAPQGYRVVKERPNRTVIVDRGRGYRERTVIRHNNNRQWNNRQWARGQRFDRRYANNYRQIDYRSYRNRGVYAPPRGYQWVQSGNDAVLVALASGLIGAVIGGAIR